MTETPGDVIVRKLTIERIEELKRIVQEEQPKYRLVVQLPLQSCYRCSDHRLPDKTLIF